MLSLAIVLAMSWLLIWVIGTVGISIDCIVSSLMSLVEATVEVVWFRCTLHVVFVVVFHSRVGVVDVYSPFDVGLENFRYVCIFCCTLEVMSLTVWMNLPLQYHL